ncbi:MAG: FtsX-like permease family protein, partial [Lachnospiraceae bacterium]|nr:FtsX-like permease family protein [Lachnospiraceae bacterium]
GDKITFEQGNRYEIEPDGNRIYYGGSYRSEERFETLSTDTCTITAILHENRPTKGYDILRGMESGTNIGLDDKGKSYLHCRVTLKEPDHTSVLQLRQIEKDYNLHLDDINSEFMISVFAIKGMGEAYTQFFMLTGIALLIVIATSVVLIYNAFGMSLAEKIRYLGMLASVGATRAQKRASIYYEGLVLGIVGIPLGILAGILGAMVTLNVLGSRLLETEVIVGAEGMRGGIPIVISPLVILTIVVLSAITIYISALVPAIKASNVMPVDAMRQTNIVKVRAGKLKINPFIKRLFGYEGVLACKNIKRNGIKGTVIVLSMAISVVMFLTIDFFNNTFVKINEYEIDLPFDIYVSCAPDEKDRLKKELEALPEVDRVVAGDYASYLFLPVDDAPGFVPVNENILKPECLTDEYKTLPERTNGIMVITVEDADFDALLKDNDLDSAEYYGDELRGVILDSFLHTEGGKSVFNDTVIGRRAFYDDPAGNPPAVEIGGIVSYREDNYVCNLVPKKTVDVYVPASMYYKKAAENIDSSALSYTFGVFHTGDTKALEEKIGDLTANGDYHNCVVHN